MPRIFLFLIFLPAAAPAPAQVLRHEYLQYDFDTAGYGFDNPDALGRAFFEELRGARELRKFFSTIEVFNYMIALSDMKHGETARLAAGVHWQQFEAQREQYCKQLLDNLDNQGFDMALAEPVEIRYDVERVNDSSVMASDIEILFSLDGDLYSILLDDCGRVKGKWFLMTPFVLWQGKVPPKQ
jgi:hypothetical protein